MAAADGYENPALVEASLLADCALANHRPECGPPASAALQTARAAAKAISVKKEPIFLVFSSVCCVAHRLHGTTMRPEGRLADERKSGAIWVLFFRQSP